MAASKPSLVRDLPESFLECSICMEFYNSPRTLPCFHSFCLQCLENLKHSTPRDRQFQCPSCRRVVAIPPNGLKDLPTNFLFVSLIDSLNLESAMGSAPWNCHFCDGIQSIHHCLECSLQVCVTCRSVHDNIRDCSDHTFIPIEKLHDVKYMKGVLTMQVPLCTEHRREKLRFYCTSCHKLVCRDCAVLTHQGHACVKAEEQLPTVKHELNIALLESYQHAKSVNGIRALVTSSKQKVVGYMLDQEQRVTEYYNILVSKLLSDKNKLIAELEKIRATKLDQLQELDDKLTTWQETMGNTQQVLEKLLERGNQWDILEKGGALTDAVTKLYGDEMELEAESSTVRNGSDIARFQVARNKFFVEKYPLNNLPALPKENILGHIPNSESLSKCIVAHKTDLPYFENSDEDLL